MWLRDCHRAPNLLLCTKCQQNWFTRSASIGRRRGNSIMPDMSGTHTMGCDHPSFIQIGPLAGNLSHFQYFPTWRPSVILNLKKINIWSRDCHCGHNLLLYTKFHQNLVSIRYSPPEILRFYNFATLAGKCLTAPPFWGFLGVLNPLILRVVIQTPKRHILGWRRVI